MIFVLMVEKEKKVDFSSKRIGCWRDAFHIKPFFCEWRLASFLKQKKPAAEAAGF